jgi:predicted nucleic acid-binding protein
VEQGSSVVVTDWVVAETGNGLARTAARRQLATAVALLRSSPRARLIHVAEPLFQRALDLYASRQDKTWGLVDCSSFLVMQDLGIHDAFTNDRHFDQAGLRCLLPLP